MNNIDMSDPLFAKNWEEIKGISKDIKKGDVYILEEESLQMMCWGFFLVGQLKTKEEILKVLKEENEKK